MGSRLAACIGLAIVAVLVVPGRAPAATTTLCARLGDRILGRPDADTFTLRGEASETLRITVDESPDPANHGTHLRLEPRRLRTRSLRPTKGPLARTIQGQLRDAAAFDLRVAELKGSARRFTGAYCLTVESSGAAAETLAGTSDVEVPWVPLAADRGSVFPPFEPVAQGDWNGGVQPVLPLVGARVYGLVVTTRVRDHDGRPLEADAAFAALAGLPVLSRGGPVARFAEDPEADDNPYPDGRLVRAAGTIHIPDRIALQGLAGDAPELAAARADLRQTAAQLGVLHGFSPVSPVEVALSRVADIATVTPASVLFIERTDGALDVAGLLAEAKRQGVRGLDVALAISFPTQEIETGHQAFRARLLEAPLTSFTPTLVDPDPTDDLRIGVFGPGDPVYGSYLAANPQVAKVVVGLLPSRDFRGPDGLFDPAKLAGTVPAPVVPLDFVLALPSSGTPPYPVIVFQHGFAGSNAQVLGRVAPALTARGLAVIGISAVSHGRRGNFFDLLTATGLKLRDIFRQTNADQTALVRMLEAGVDVDGAGVPDLDASRIGYLGISLGGLMGGAFVATEPRIRAAVLNVMSGRTALNGLNAAAGPIFEQSLATRVGLTVGTPAFAAYLDRQIALGVHAANEADALNFARRWVRQPLPGYAPRRILMQEGVGDPLVWNVLTEELAMVAGLPTGVASSDPAGVSGHWIFDMPGGHGIFDGRADVRDQAARYLAADGTEIAAPAGP